MKESVLIPVMSLFFKAFYVLVNGLMEFLVATKHFSGVGWAPAA